MLMKPDALSLKDLEWNDYVGMSVFDRSRLFHVNGKPYHTLLSQQFDRRLLDRLGALATMIRKVAKTRGGRHFLQSLLSEKRAMLYFSQPSTRTFLSFYSACQIVGMQCAEVRDAHTSSEIKGESQEDSVRTFSSYFDLIIMRHPGAGFAERIAWLLSQTDRPIPVMNAGSGKDQHPTQALLDIYTLQRSFEKWGGIEGKTVAFVGDLLRGRTVRSLAWLLTLYPGVKQVFVAPPGLQISEDMVELLKSAGTEVEVTDDFESVIPRVDAIYMTRIQDEWDTASDSIQVDTTKYHFEERHLEVLKPDAILMHPLPRRKEIAPEVDRDPRAKYWRQVRNGMWIRTALILMTFDRDQEIDRYYEDLMRD
ncbi:MAG TPA: aspartate carbamoyltransferase [Kiritimatiellia bacterium]|nr:aspartate carbamoyltransferase [Kiritimatiellia bacterium]